MNNEYLRIVIDRLKSAYLVMPVLAILLILVWVKAIAPAESLPYDKVSAKQGNLLENSSFEQWQNGLPEGWSVTTPANSVAEYSVTKISGQIDGSGLFVSIPSLQRGVVEVGSPIITASPNSAYFFKSFYKTDTSISIFAKYYYQNGSNSYKLLKELPDYDYDLSSMSTVIQSEPSVKAFQIMIMVNASGYLEMDSAYIIQKKDPINPVAAIVNNDSLIDWGIKPANYPKPDFSFAPQPRPVIIKPIEVNSKNWRSSWIPAQPYELYNFSFDYDATNNIGVWVDYQKNDGSFFSWKISDIPPCPHKSNSSLEVEIPKDVVYYQISFQMLESGSLKISEAMSSLKESAKSFQSPIVSVTFDDGWLSAKENGAQILGRMGDMKATYYINPGTLNTTEIMTDSDIQDLRRAGHQIGSHTYSHIDITSYSLDFIRRDMQKANNYFYKLGIDKIDFASPYGKYDNNVLDITMQSNASNRGTEKGINTKNNIDRSMLKALFIRKDISDAELKEYLSRTKETNGWLILIYHKIEASDSEFDIDRETFQRHMQIVKDSNIKVKTVRSALESIQ